MFTVFFTGHCTVTLRDGLKLLVSEFNLPSQGPHGPSPTDSLSESHSPVPPGGELAIARSGMPSPILKLHCRMPAADTSFWLRSRQNPMFMKYHGRVSRSSKPIAHDGIITVILLQVFCHTYPGVDPCEALLDGHRAGVDLLASPAPSSPFQAGVPDEKAEGVRREPHEPCTTGEESTAMLAMPEKTGGGETGEAEAGGEPGTDEPKRGTSEDSA